MLTGIRKKKITLLFLILDTDENGYLERQDFERGAKALANANDISLFSDAYRELKETFVNIYKSICEMMDENENYRVELDEWMTYFSETLADAKKYNQAIAPMSRYMFNMLDHNENGKVSVTEWRRFAHAYQITDEDVDDLFESIDANDSGYITLDEFNRMMTDFFMSEDPDKPGNYILGKF